MRYTWIVLLALLGSCLPLTSQTFHKVPGLDIRGPVQHLDTFQNRLLVSAPIYFPWSQVPFEFNECIATWKDSIQYPLDSGLTVFALTSCMYQNKLILGGDFQNQQWEVPDFDHLVGWDGVQWTNITNNTFVGGGNVRAVCVYNDTLYAAGQFTSIGGIPALDIAKWDGSNWTTVGPGFVGNCYVNCMKVFNGELYVGGYFGIPNGPNNYYYNLAKWNGTVWDSVGGSFDWVINDMEVDPLNNILYAAGIFSNCPSGPSTFLAQYNGATWSSVGDDTLNTHCIRGGIHALEMFNGNLFAGGYPNMTPTDTVLSYWDGNNWTHLPTFLNSDVRVMQVYDSNLYIGGYISQVILGDTSAHWIVCYGNSCPTSTVGIQEHSELPPINLFPNPSSENIIVDVGDLTSMNCQLKIVNAQGMEILIQDLNARRTSIDVSQWVSGTYIFTVLDKDLRPLAQSKAIIGQ